MGAREQIVDLSTERNDRGSQRILGNITKDPELARSVLTDLVRSPRISTERSVIAALRKERGDRYVKLHKLLGEVIADRGLYLSLDIPEEALDMAFSDPEQQKRIDEIRANRPDVNVEFLTMQNRANELLAVSQLAIAASGIETELTS